MIRHNWKYKLLALAVALILWTYVNSERNPQSHQTFRVPVNAVEVARGHIAELDADKVTVTVAGLKTAVDAVTKEDVQALVNMRSLPSDRKVVQASLPVEVRLPRAMANDLDVIASPKTLRVRMEALAQRHMPVEVNFTSDPPPGYSYSSPLLNPDTVIVSGRVTQLAKVSSVSITLSGDSAGSSTVDSFEVTPVDAHGNAVAGVSAKPAKVRAKLGMIEVPATKTVIVSPIFSGQPKFPARVWKYTVAPSSVTLEGKPSKLSEVSAISTETVALEGADSTITREVDLQVPPGTKPIGARTVKVTVYIGAN
jgi:YbbR domain-containing protein